MKRALSAPKNQAVAHFLASVAECARVVGGLAITAVSVTGLIFGNACLLGLFSDPRFTFGGIGLALRIITLTGVTFDGIALLAILTFIVRDHLRLRREEAAILRGYW